MNCPNPWFPCVVSFLLLLLLLICCECEESVLCGTCGGTDATVSCVNATGVVKCDGMCYIYGALKQGEWHRGCNSQIDFQECKNSQKNMHCCKADNCNLVFPKVSCYFCLSKGSSGCAKYTDEGYAWGYTENPKYPENSTNLRCEYCYVRETNETGIYEYGCVGRTGGKLDVSPSECNKTLKGERGTCCAQSDCNDSIEEGMLCHFCPPGMEMCNDSQASTYIRSEVRHDTPWLEYNPRCLFCYIERSSTQGKHRRGCFQRNEYYEKCNIDGIICCNGTQCNMDIDEAESFQIEVEHERSLTAISCYTCSSPCKNKKDNSEKRESCYACLTVFHGKDDQAVSRHCVENEETARMFANGTMTEWDSLDAWPCFTDNCNSLPFFTC